MHGRILRVFVVVFFAFIAAVGARRDQGAPATSPVVAVFVVDGLRPDTIDPQVTPTLFRLQQEGTSYLDSHAVVPTVTRVNGASLATGMYPNRHGLVGNSMFVPGVDAAGPFSAGEWRNLVRLAEASGGRLLTVPTLAERLARRGLSFVAVSSGSTGSGFVLNPESPHGVGVLVGGGLEAGTRVAFPDALNRALLTRFGAAPAEEGAARLEWTERIVREHVMPELKAVLLIDWLTEPDAAQHTYGVGSTQARTALGNSDRNLAAFLETAGKLGLTDRLHVIVTSDHGFARHGEAFSIADALVAAGVKRSKDSDDVMVVSNAQSAALHVKNRNRATIQRVAERLLAQPWVDLVFTAPSDNRGVPPPPAASRGPRHVQGSVPGTFAIDLLRGQHPERGADLVVTLRWSSDVNSYGVPGTQVIDSLSQAGLLTGQGSGHGGLSPWAVRNTLIAWGPKFKRARSVRAPAAIVDVAATALALLGVDGEDLDGRVLREALIDGPDPEQTGMWRETHRVQAAEYEGFVQVSGTGSSWYLDKGWSTRTAR